MDDLLIVLACVAPLALYVAVTKGRGRQKAKYACLGLALAFLYFAAGHFFLADELVQMLPPWVPLRKFIIHATGGFELLIVVGLLSTRWRRPAGVMSAIVLVAFFPANIYAAMNSTGVGAHQLGPSYLLIRVPLQLFLLAWACWPLIWPDAPGELAVHRDGRHRWRRRHKRDGPIIVAETATDKEKPTWQQFS